MTAPSLTAPSRTARARGGARSAVTRAVPLTTLAETAERGSQ
ncbi:hypothetical protein [Streptosporangium sp. NPDC000396]